jgi:putative tricarboxylic transport membrane protein
MVYGFLTASLPNRSLPNTPGPAFFPWLITGVLIVLSAALLIRALLDADSDSRQSAADSSSKLRALTLVWIIVYLVALPYAGFLVASVPFFAGMMRFYGERNRTVILLATAIIPGGLGYVFRYGFQILLPTGVW